MRAAPEPEASAYGMYVPGIPDLARGALERLESVEVQMALAELDWANGLIVDEEPEINKMPAHVAVIMDGNGRWARGKNRPRLFGHNAGMQAMKKKEPDLIYIIKM